MVLEYLKRSKAITLRGFIYIVLNTDSFFLKLPGP